MDSNKRKDIILPSGIDQSQLVSIGMEMKRGYWVLLTNGTLHFFGGDVLEYAAYDSYKSQVRRIVIDDFWAIGPHAFEGFSECTEVVLSRPFVQILDCAFAHCHKLEKVVFPEEIDAEESAFRDTPYEAKQHNVEFVPEYLRHNSISKGEWGQKLLKAINDDIEKMYTDDATDREIEYGPLDDSGKFSRRIFYFYYFSDSIDIIIHGALAGEPELMYLLAEHLHYSEDTRVPVQDYIDVLSNRSVDLSEREWYILAAKSGSELARLWCAFCMDTGECGFEEDHESAEAMLQGIKSWPETLALPELAFMVEAVDDIHEKAYDADRIEDDIADAYHYVQGTYEHLLPHPSWQTLHTNADNVSAFMAQIGLPYVLDTEEYYNRDPDIDNTIEQIKTEKNKWLSWCDNKGLKIRLM